MKRILTLWIVLIGGFLYPLKSVGQIVLSIDTIINLPDTAYQGLTTSMVIIVRNSGNTPYQGALQVNIRADSLPTQYLYYSQNPNFILLPGDTASLTTGGAGFTFDSSHFKTGNNVVVVWPYSTQAITFAFFTTSVYFKANVFAGLPSQPGIKKLKVYPNPGKEIVVIESPLDNLEGVRILDLSGRLITEVKQLNVSSWQLPIAGLKPGCYLLEVIATDDKRSIIKLVKTE